MSLSGSYPCNAAIFRTHTFPPTPAPTPAVAIPAIPTPAINIPAIATPAITTPANPTPAIPPPATPTSALHHFCVVRPADATFHNNHHKSASLSPLIYRFHNYIMRPEDAANTLG